ncbi:8775_t:CDS:2 [Ambispora leptoticha]|uniref:8775_t:CDS:1 n=1 Tax=Ambispora leptoticha TaxID=144679 RepID=A0A9N9B5K1_9GLOM|nr:8775_t:CDS:2 [Ambispora leptoticha]
MTFFYKKSSFIVFLIFTFLIVTTSGVSNEVLYPEKVKPPNAVPIAKLPSEKKEKNDHKNKEPVKVDPIINEYMTKK